MGELEAAREVDAPEAGALGRYSRFAFSEPLGCGLAHGQSRGKENESHPPNKTRSRDPTAYPSRLVSAAKQACAEKPADCPFSAIGTVMSHGKKLLCSSASGLVTNLWRQAR